MNSSYGTTWQDSVNEEIESLALKNPNITLLDWPSEGKAHPEWSYEDGIHLNPDGQAGVRKVHQGIDRGMTQASQLMYNSGGRPPGSAEQSIVGGTQKSAAHQMGRNTIMQQKTILIVEDDDSVRFLLKLTLQTGGYKVMECADWQEAAGVIPGASYDLALLDIMLPGRDGLSLLPLVRARNLPVIFLTAKGTLTDRVSGLKMGADDYVAKPFEPLELPARVEAVLRRYTAEAGDTPEILSYGVISLDATAHTVSMDGRPAELTEKEYALLEFFMRHPGQAFSREQLISSVWGYDY